MYSIYKNNKGITLVALVVTIIVLLILAVVSINLVLGENGIITKSKESKIATNSSKTSSDLSLMLDEYKIDEQTDKNYLNLENFFESKIGNGIDDFCSGAEAGTYIVTMNGFDLTVNEESLENIVVEPEAEKPDVTVSQITTENEELDGESTYDKIRLKVNVVNKSEFSRFKFTLKKGVKTLEEYENQTGTINFYVDSNGIYKISVKAIKDDEIKFKTCSEIVNRTNVKPVINYAKEKLPAKNYEWEIFSGKKEKDENGNETGKYTNLKLITIGYLLVSDAPKTQDGYIPSRGISDCSICFQDKDSKFAMDYLKDACWTTSFVDDEFGGICTGGPSVSEINEAMGKSDLNSFESVLNSHPYVGSNRGSDYGISYSDGCYWIASLNSNDLCFMRKGEIKTSYSDGNYAYGFRFNQGWGFGLRPIITLDASVKAVPQSDGTYKLEK